MSLGVSTVGMDVNILIDLVCEAPVNTTFDFSKR